MCLENHLIFLSFCLPGYMAYYDSPWPSDHQLVTVFGHGVTVVTVCGWGTVSSYLHLLSVADQTWVSLVRPNMTSIKTSQGEPEGLHKSPKIHKKSCANR